MPTAPIKIYLGTQVEQSLAVDVLAYSIAKHSSQPVQIVPLFQAVKAAGIHLPTPVNPQLRPRTPFTFQRFAIPALCQYQGRAIYLDSDMLVFRDIAELWQQPFNGAALLSVPEQTGSGRSPQYSVMLLDCEALSWQADKLIGQLEQGQWTYEQFVLQMAPAPRKAATLPLGWNDLERYSPEQTALLHYTDMPRQPWLSVANPHAALWCGCLLSAINEGAITRAAVKYSVEKGWVRPSLLYQVDQGMADPQQLPARILQRDRFTFSPPHVWQRYLRHSALQGRRSRQWFNRAYATFRATTQTIRRAVS
jgi:hypothetical protein